MVDIDVRGYAPERDFKSVRRIWEEVGWIEGKRSGRLLKDFLGTGPCLVGCIDGAAECAVHTVAGVMRHGANDVSLCAVTAVTTSRIGRKLGLAGRLTGQSLATAAADGAQLAALGMFEQGFYDLLGFGTGAYEYRLFFDPATLNVPAQYRTPRRLTHEDWPAMQRAMVKRLRGHGGVVLHDPLIMKAELGWIDSFFALGYGTGKELSHFVAGEANGENGPYHIHWQAYQTTDQLLELMALIRALGDQVSTFSMLEPPELQLQDLLRAPFRHRRATRASKHENLHQAVAYWQVRMLDVAACLAKTEMPRADCTFGLTLTDPLADRDDVGWNGVQGEYTVHLGSRSWAEAGRDPQMPHLTAGVGAFTRMWLGVRSATSLSLTDELRGPDALLAELDAAVCLPRPSFTWDF